MSKETPTGTHRLINRYINSFFVLFWALGPVCIEMDWSVYSARQGIRSRPSKHLWESNRMVLVSKDQYQRAMEAQTVKMEDQEPVIKMVYPVTHEAAEMVASRP